MRRFLSVTRSLSGRALFSAGCVLGTALSLGACDRFDARSPARLDRPHNRLLDVDRGARGTSDSLRGGVNAYLWRGALDTLSFMPLDSADAEGGVILTDWYSPPQDANERFKMAVYILDRRLRSDAVCLVIFRQARAPDGSWRDEAVAASTVADITTHILERARRLRAQNA